MLVFWSSIKVKLVGMCIPLLILLMLLLSKEIIINSTTSLVLSFCIDCDISACIMFLYLQYRDFLCFFKIYLSVLCCLNAFCVLLLIVVTEDIFSFVFFIK